MIGLDKVAIGRQWGRLKRWPGDFDGFFVSLDGWRRHAAAGIGFVRMSPAWP
jgi:hypothetical protein